MQALHGIVAFLNLTNTNISEGSILLKHWKSEVISHDRTSKALYRDLTNKIKVYLLYIRGRMPTHDLVKFTTRQELLRDDIFSLRYLTNFQYPKNYVSRKALLKTNK